MHHGNMTFKQKQHEEQAEPDGTGGNYYIYVFSWRRERSPVDFLSQQDPKFQKKQHAKQLKGSSYHYQ